MWSMDLIGTGVKTVAMLMVVLGLLFAALWAFKRFLQPGGRMQNGINIKLRSSLYLSPKQRIAVVDVGEATLVLGVTAEKISLLTELAGFPDETVQAGRAGKELPNES